jgi:hypothetical protein
MTEEMPDKTIRTWDRIWAAWLGIVALTFAILEARGLTEDKRKTLTHWIRRRIRSVGSIVGNRVARWGFLVTFGLFILWMLVHFLSTEGF